MKMHSFQHYSQDLGNTMHDAWITAKVKSALALARTTRGLHIGVRTQAGMVTLSGRVASHRQCQQAVEVARSVQGVHEVHADNLELYVFTPGSIPGAPNAEETREYQVPRMDDGRQ